MLSTCPKCGNKVSSTASRCPQCGALGPAANSPNDMAYAVGAIAGIVFVTMWLLGWGGPNAWLVHWTNSR